MYRLRFNSLLALRNQQGAFSPFMFGLVFGVGIFSTLVMYWAKQDLLRLEQLQAERAKAEAEDIAKALEFALLTETDATYSDDLSLNRARQYTNYSDGKTRGGEDILLTERLGDSSFEQQHSKVAITASDDIFLRSDMNRKGSADDLARLTPGKDQAVVVFSSEKIRTQQIARSRQNMDTMAEQIYQFYGAQLRFPTASEYDSLNDKLGIRDVWGRPFDYQLIDTDKARLEFVTPWGYSQTLDLNL